MGTKGFHVDPKALAAVADRVDSLLNDLVGNSGYIAGNMKEFARAADISGPLATFWQTRENVFALAYGDAHGAISLTMAKIQEQLTNLSSAARQTAAQYDKQDKTSSAHVKQTLPDDMK